MTDLIPILDVLDGDTDLIGHLVAHLGEIHGFEALRFTRVDGNVRICRHPDDVDVDGLFRGIGEDLRAAEVDRSPLIVRTDGGVVLAPGVVFAEPDPPEQFRPVSRANPLTKYPVVVEKIVVASPTVTITHVPKPDPEPEPVEPARSPVVRVPVEGGGPDGTPQLPVSDTVATAASDTGSGTAVTPGRGGVAGPGRVTRQQVADYLAAHPETQTTDIATALDANLKDVGNRLQKLRMDGKASQTHLLWSLTPDDDDQGDDSPAPEVVDPDPDYVAFITEMVETYGTETDPVTATVTHDQMPPKWSARYSVTHTKAVLVDLAKAGQILTARGGRYYPKPNPNTRNEA